MLFSYAQARQEKIRSGVHSGIRSICISGTPMSLLRSQVRHAKSDVVARVRAIAHGFEQSFKSPALPLEAIQNQKESARMIKRTRSGVAHGAGQEEPLERPRLTCCRELCRLLLQPTEQDCRFCDHPDHQQVWNSPSCFTEQQSGIRTLGDAVHQQGVNQTCLAGDPRTHGT